MSGLLNRMRAAGLCAALAGMAFPPAHAALAPWSALHGKTVLFVTGAGDSATPNDDALVARHLEQLGFVVHTVDAAAPASDADGATLIVLSSTANAHVLGNKYADTPVPVFTWNTYDYPNLGLTGPALHRDFEVIDPVQHYPDSFAVLYAYGANITSQISRAVGLKPQLFGTLYLEPQTAGWGRPGPGGTVIADFKGMADHAAVFTYEREASLEDGRVAPARRVAFFLGDDDFHLLTAAYGPAADDPNMRSWAIGLELFDTALRWAASTPPAMPAYDPPALEATLRRVAHRRKILFVERADAGEGAEADAHIVAHLRSLGFTVTVADQSDPETRARGQDLVIVSGTCSKWKLANKYADIAIPVVSLEGLMSDTMHFSGFDRYVDYGEHGEERESDDPAESYLDIVGAWSPMAAGAKPGLVKFATEPGVLKWARPLPDAIVIATLPNEPQECAIFGYPKGARMAGGFIAPARRSLLPLDNPTYDQLTPQGSAIFDAVVLWTLGR
ncbi:MAG TPA: hypothetical protein VGR92_00445 [Steroidobacteraceae bacterium]|nr:hypothetical protein [Steroidobacteraceae bacterium]